MAIAENKERLAITLDKPTVEQIKEIAESETRSVSNVIQILVEHGLRDRGKYRFGPAWCNRILNKHITFERSSADWNGSYLMTEDGEEVPDVEHSLYLEIGLVVDIVEWQGFMRLVVEVDKRDHAGEATDEKELVFVFPQDIVKVIGEQSRMLYSRASDASALPDLKMAESPSASGEHKGRRKAKQHGK